MVNKLNWDDIPTLKLELDDNYTPEKTGDLRAAARLAHQDLSKILMDNTTIVYVQVVTSKGTLPQKGVLKDISQNGMGFILPAHGLQRNDSIWIVTRLVKFVFKTKAIVRWVTNDQVGVEYYKPKPEDIIFLSELYPAKILNRI
jgi:hypothetical protein